MDIERQRRREEAEREAIEEALRSHRMTWGNEPVTALGHVSSILILWWFFVRPWVKTGVGGRTDLLFIGPRRRKCERVDVLAQEKQRLWKVRHQERKQRETTCESLKETMSPSWLQWAFWVLIVDFGCLITVVCRLTSHHFILNKPLKILGKKPFFTVVQLDFHNLGPDLNIYIYRAWFSMVVAQCLSNAQGGLLWHPNGQAWYQNCPWHWVLSVQARQSWRSSLRPRPFDSPAFGGGHRDPKWLTTKVLWGWQEAAQIQCLKIVHNISVL